MKAKFCKTVFKSGKNKIEIDFETFFNHIEKCPECKSELENVKNEVVKKFPILGMIIKQLI